MYEELELYKKSDEHFVHRSFDDMCASARDIFALGKCDITSLHSVAI